MFPLALRPVGTGGASSSRTVIVAEPADNAAIVSVLSLLLTLAVAIPEGEVEAV